MHENDDNSPMTSAHESLEHRVRLTALVERFHCVLFPFDLTFLFDRLPDAGWIVGERFDEAAEQGGSIRAPVKGNVRLRVDQANKMLGVHGRAPLETLDAFRELRSLAIETSAVAPDVTTHYVEFRYVGEIKGSSPPPESLRKFWSQSPHSLALGAMFSELLPSDTALGQYGIRLAPAVDPNRPNWTELSLVPVNNTGQQDYHFDLLFRHTERTTVENVAENAIMIVDKLVAVLEGRA